MTGIILSCIDHPSKHQGKHDNERHYLQDPPDPDAGLPVIDAGGRFTGRWHHPVSKAGNNPGPFKQQMGEDGENKEKSRDIEASRQEVKNGRPD